MPTHYLPPSLGPNCLARDSKPATAKAVYAELGDDGITVGTLSVHAIFVQALSVQTVAAWFCIDAAVGKKKKTRLSWS
jgi:hypothetical protein